MSGIGDAFRPFGKEYDAHFVGCESCAEKDAEIASLTADLAAERERRDEAETLMLAMRNCRDSQQEETADAIDAHREKWGRT